MAEKSFEQLSSEFNTAAEGWMTGATSAATLTLRFNILLRHCTETEDNKHWLVTKLLETTLKRLGCLTPDTATDGLTDSFMEQYSTVLDALAAPEAACVMPEKAPRALADIALDVLDLRNGSKLMHTERHTYDVFSGLLLSYADKFAATISKRNLENPTPQHIAVPKQITLKKPAAAQ
ncbi:MAG: hypothetical protein ACAH80_12450 [Alphaproteobacteria bacterium]